MWELSDHPDIESLILTGYSRGSQPQPHYCELCECELDKNKNVYEDDYYEYLCRFCLLLIHRKRW